MVIVFDGVCNVCNGYVRFLLKRDAAGRLSFASAQSNYGSRVLADMGERPDDPSTIVLIDGERRFLRSEAVLRAVAALGGPWRAALIGLAVPRFIRDAAYTGFARRRYRWFGKSDVCPAPDPKWRERFLA